MYFCTVNRVMVCTLSSTHWQLHASKLSNWFGNIEINAPINIVIIIIIIIIIAALYLEGAWLCCTAFVMSEGVNGNTKANSWCDLANNKLLESWILPKNILVFFKGTAILLTFFCFFFVIRHCWLIVEDKNELDLVGSYSVAILIW